ncbi:MAG: MarC family protein, partial [Phycisphaerae bacterium]
MKSFLLTFVPIFVSVDAIGVLPIFMNLTEGLDKVQRRTVVLQSFLTALGVAIGFIFLGKAIFNLMGVTVQDFMVAGGV